MPTTVADLVASFGFPIAACVALAWFVRYMITEWRKEYQRREAESLVREQRLGERLDVIEDEYRNDVKSMVQLQTKIIARNTEAIRESSEILRTFCEVVRTRPCLTQRPESDVYIATASSPDLPPPPARRQDEESNHPSREKRSPRHA